MNTTSRFRRRFAWLAALALVLLIAACAQQVKPPEEEEEEVEVIDPLTIETPFAVTAANPSAAEGAIFGLLIRPFESIGKLATEDYGAFRNAFVDTTLAADGAIEGRFIAPSSVPRINEGLFGLAHPSFGGYYGADMIFFPPEACPMTTTNPDEAALATVPYLVVWDGSTLDEEGFPVIEAALSTGRWEETIGMDTYSETNEAIVPVMSRSAWSAATDGACTYDDDDGMILLSNGAAAPAFAPPVTRTFTFDVDIDLEVGWQFLHVTYTDAEDASTRSESIVVRTLGVDEVDDLSDLWTVGETVSLAAVTTTRPSPVFERLFR